MEQFNKLSNYSVYPWTELPGARPVTGEAGPSHGKTATRINTEIEANMCTMTGLEELPNLPDHTCHQHIDQLALAARIQHADVPQRHLLVRV